MKSRIRSPESYADRLARWARALALGRPEEIPDALPEEMPPGLVDMFVEGNFDKRCQLLMKHVEFVARSIEDLEDLLHDYLHETPMAADATGATDADRFLEWLEQTADLTLEERDAIACQRARFAVEQLGRARRREHLRFQELWSVSGALAEELDLNRALHVHLNPLRVWSRFETPALLGGAADPPADVLFFAVRSSVSTAVLAHAGQELVRVLEVHGPCTLYEWSLFGPGVERRELAAIARTLAAMGLVAFS
jgi:hypothetical protein